MKDWKTERVSIHREAAFFLSFGFLYKANWHQSKDIKPIKEIIKYWKCSLSRSLCQNRLLQIWFDGISKYWVNTTVHGVYGAVRSGPGLFQPHFSSQYYSGCMYVYSTKQQVQMHHENYPVGKKKPKARGQFEVGQIPSWRKTTGFWSKLKTKRCVGLCF